MDAPGAQALESNGSLVAVVNAPLIWQLLSVEPGVARTGGP